MGPRVQFETRRALHTATRIRSFELAQTALWQLGLLPGELHTSIGEEGIVVGVVDHLRGGDAMALDHRSTGPLVARGVEPGELLLDVLGSDLGPSRGWAGHMHLASPAYLAAADGIVGSSGPISCGFAVAARQLRPGTVAVAFFGEGAANQGMLLESLNLAVAWRLPVVFVCKDSGWSITTRTSEVTGGSLLDRARGFGLPVRRVKGWRTHDVHAAAGRLVARARAGKGPGFLLARCHRPRGHFEGDPLVDLVHHPVQEAPDVLRPVAHGALASQGAPTAARARALKELTGRVVRYGADERIGRRDPLTHLRSTLGDEATDVVDGAASEMERTVRMTLEQAGYDEETMHRVARLQEALT